MSLKDSVNYSLGTMAAATEHTPMVFVEDFKNVYFTVIAATSANATVKFYASDSDTRPNLWAAPSATNIYSPVEVINVDTWAAIDWSVGIAWAWSADGITRYQANSSWARWIGAIMTARSAGNVTITLQAFNE